MERGKVSSSSRYSMILCGIELALSVWNACHAEQERRSAAQRSGRPAGVRRHFQWTSPEQVSSRRDILSARSKQVPSRRKCQISPRGVVESAMP